MTNEEHYVTSVRYPRALIAQVQTYRAKRCQETGLMMSLHDALRSLVERGLRDATRARK